MKHEASKSPKSSVKVRYMEAKLFSVDVVFDLQDGQFIKDRVQALVWVRSSCDKIPCYKKFQMKYILC